MEQKNLVQPALEANFISAVCFGSREAVVSVLSSIRIKCIENVHYIVYDILIAELIRFLLMLGSIQFIFTI